MQIALFANLLRPQAIQSVRELVSMLHAEGHAVRMAYALAEATGCAGDGVAEGQVVPGADLAIAIGGDGTMLGAVRAATPHQVPVLGVNAGALGFLTELTPEELPTYLPRVLARDFTIESRLLLRACIKRASVQIAELHALNDIVVRQGAKGRLINLDVAVAGHQLGRFGADGIIVSTPSGSTAYGLAAGGPILHPATSVLELVPICPHSLSFRPMVIPASDSVEILCESNQHGDEMMVTADGQEPIPVLAGDRIAIHVGAENALLVKLGLSSFYDRLREKLQWGGRA